MTDILDAVPIDKYFELFKPNAGGEGGYIRIRCAVPGGLGHSSKPSIFRAWPVERLLRMGMSMVEGACMCGKTGVWGRKADGATAPAAALRL